MTKPSENTDAAKMFQLSKYLHWAFQTLAVCSRGGVLRSTGENIYCGELAAYSKTVDGDVDLACPWCLVFSVDDPGLYELLPHGAAVIRFHRVRALAIELSASTFETAPERLEELWPEIVGTTSALLAALPRCPKDPTAGCLRCTYSEIPGALAVLERKYIELSGITARGGDA